MDHSSEENNSEPQDDTTEIHPQEKITENGNGTVANGHSHSAAPSIKSEEKPLELNDVIGEFGKWHMWILFVGMVEQVLGPANILAVVFMAPEVDFWCARPQSVNVSIKNWVNMTTKEGDEDQGRCWRHELDLDKINLSRIVKPTNRSIECKEWEYDHSVFESTIVEEWSLVCDRSWLVSLSQTLFMAGFLTACLILGPMADWFGRRPVIWMSSLMFVVAGTVCAFSPNYIVYGISRFFVAFGRTGAANTLFVLTLESVSTKWRSTISLVTGFAWNVGLLALSGIAYLLRNWFYLQVVLAATSVLIVIFSWFIPESPRWLISNGRLKTAEKVMKRAAKLNGAKDMDMTEAVHILAGQVEDSTVPKRYSVVDLLRTPNMRKKTLMLYFIWAVVSFVFYGLSLNLGDMGGNLFLNNAIVGAAQVPFKLATLFAVKSNLFGRKYTLIILLVTVSLCCFAIIPLSPEARQEEFLWFRITLAVVAISVMTCCFSVIYIFSAEIFPTTVRSLGVTSCSVFARVGSMVAPFTKEMGENNDFMVPLGVFGVLCIFCALTLLPLPETNNYPLPETLEEAEDFVRKPRKTKPSDDQRSPSETLETGT